MTARTIIRGLSGTPQNGEWRVECWGHEEWDRWPRWQGYADSYTAAWKAGAEHLSSWRHLSLCLAQGAALDAAPVVEVVEASPEEWPPAGYLGPSWDDLLPTPPAPPKPRGRVLVGAARALVGTVSGRPS